MSNPYAPPPRGAQARPPSDSSGTVEPTGTGPTGTPPDRGHTGPPAGPERRASRTRAPKPEPLPPLPPDSEAVQQASRRVMHFGLVVLATFVTSALPLPWQLAAIAFGITAAVYGVRALRAVKRARLRGGMAPVVTLGLVFSVMVSVSLLGTLSILPMRIELQECLQGALTISAREQCADDFDAAVRERFQMPSAPRD